jgi:microcystin-dependent protein
MSLYLGTDFIAGYTPPVATGSFFVSASSTGTSISFTQGNGVTQSVAVDSTPIGTVQMYGGAAAPTGWLLCTGSAVSRTTYANLFSVIGTTYGIGDNISTFNLPDFRGRMPLGAGTGTGLTARTLGEASGSETHVLTIAQMPSHSHSINAPLSNNPSGGGSGLPVGVAQGSVTASNSTGSSNPFPLMNPYLVVNYLIKF